MPCGYALTLALMRKHDAVPLAYRQLLTMPRLHNCSDEAIAYAR